MIRYKLIVSAININNDYNVNLILRKYGYSGAFKYTDDCSGYVDLVTPTDSDEDKELYQLVGEFICAGFVAKVESIK